MVRVASLAFFPKSVISKDFYAHVPLASNPPPETDQEYKRRERARLRKRRERARRKSETSIPVEIMSLIQNNGGR